MANINRIYGIKFPFTANNEDGLFIDVDKTLDDKVASQIVHVILTPKRSRLRQPEFGTDLIKFIFEPSDDVVWSDVRQEVISAVSKYVKNVQLNDIRIIRDDSNDNSIIMTLNYSVVKGGEIENKTLAVKI